MLSRNAIQEGQTKKTVPIRYLCPITKQIMSDPVVAADGCTYSLLQRFIMQGNQAAVIWLLNHQANLEHSNHEANTPLLLAILQGSPARAAGL